MNDVAEHLRMLQEEDRHRERAMLFIALPVAVTIIAITQLIQVMGMQSRLPTQIAATLVYAVGAITLIAAVCVPIGIFTGVNLLRLANRRMTELVAWLPPDATASVRVQPGTKAGNLAVVRSGHTGFLLIATRYGWAIHATCSRALMASFLILTTFVMGGAIAKNGAMLGVIGTIAIMLLIHAAPLLFGARTRFLDVHRDQGHFIIRTGSKVWGVPLPLFGRTTTCRSLTLHATSDRQGPRTTWSFVLRDADGKLIFEHELRAGDIGRYHAVLVRDALTNALRENDNTARS